MATKIFKDIDKHYNLPILIVLLLLCIQFIASEFTFINTHPTILNINNNINNQTASTNAYKIIIYISRILGYIIGILLYIYGEFRFIVLIGSILLGISFIFHLILMITIVTTNDYKPINDNESINTDEYIT